jgi:predicted RNA-binding Zn-ribbon protein involved in translation (DUF1610 family)
MPKYEVHVSISAERDLGVMEATDEREISKKVRKEGLTFEGVPDEIIDLLDLEVDEVFADEIIENPHEGTVNVFMPNMMSVRVKCPNCGQEYIAGFGVDLKSQKCNCGYELKCESTDTWIIL